MKSRMNTIVKLSLFVGLIQATSSVVALGSEGPGFEIWNFDTVPVWFEVDVRDKTQTLYIVPDTNATLKIDLNAPLTIKLYMSKNEKDQGTPTVTWETKPSAVGKTKYFSFNRKKYNVSIKWIYPQSGTFGGLFGRSKSGWSLSKNIKEADYGV